MISVIIVNFNGKYYTEACIESVLSQTGPDYEIILIDNASSDDSAEFFRLRFPQVNVVKNKINRGFAGGVNDGIRISRGDYILTLNNDTIMEKGFITEMKKVMESDPAIGMCASKMVFPDGRINSAGICISRSGAAWDRGMFEDDQGQYDNVAEVFGPCGGAALYRMKMIEDIGLFDEDFFLFMEDVDLAFRARLMGWICVYVPSARVVHIHGGTAGFRSSLSIYYGNRNIVWYVVKNFPIRTLLFCFPWILGRNCAVVLYHLARKNGTAAIRAKIDAILGIGKMMHKRTTIQRKISESELRRWIRPWARIEKIPADNSKSPLSVKV